MHTFTLNNGLRVVVEHISSSPVEAIYMFYNVGAKNEHEGIFGGSHLVEHVLFRRIKGLDKSIDEIVEGVGGYFNGFTSFDFTAYVEVLPVDKAELGFMIESMRMRGALFLNEEFELERRIVLSEFDMHENDEEFRMALIASRKMWSTHPYRHLVIGVRRDLESVTRDQLYEYYQAYYNPGNSTLVCVGGLREDDAVKLAEKYFSSIEPGGKVGSTTPWDEDSEEFVKVSVRGPSKVRRMLIMLKAPGLHSPNYPSFILTDFIIAGDRQPVYGLTAPEPVSVPRFSRLYRLVEEGLASSVVTDYSLTYMNGPYFVVLRDVKDFEKALDRFIEIVSEEPKDDELESAKARIKARASSMLDSPSKLGQAYGLGSILFNEPHRLIDLYNSALKAGSDDFKSTVKFMTRSIVVVQYG